MRQYLLPVLVIAMLNAIPVQVYKRRFGDALPMTLFCIPVALFASQFLFHTFIVGTVALCIAAVVGTVAMVLRKTEKRLYLSYGLIAYLVVCAIILAIDYHRTFTDFDEFWHWGPMIKEMLRLDQFYSVAASRMVIHKDYPPFLPLVELFWSHIAGAYNEGSVSAALHIFFSTLIVAPVVERVPFTKRSLKHAVVFCIAACISFLILIGVFDLKRASLTILVDTPVAVFFAFSVYWILCGEAYESTFGRIVLVLSGIMLVMAKQIGIALLPTAIGLYVVVGIVRRHGSYATYITAALFSAIPYAFYFGWGAYISTLNINDIRAAEEGTGLVSMAKIDIDTFIRALQGRAPGLQQDTLWNFLRALFERNISALPWLPITFVTSLAIVVLLLMLLCKKFGEYLDVKTAVSTGVVFFIGAIGYVLALALVFVFCFLPDEMMELRGFERYAGSFALGLTLPLVMMLVVAVGQKKDWFQRTFPVVAFTLAVVVLYGTNIINLVPRAMMEEQAKQYHEMASEISDKTQQDSTTLMVYNAADYGGWYGYVQTFVSYYANDHDIPSSFDFYSADYTNEDVRAAALNQLRHADYLYIVQTNDQMKEFLSAYNTEVQLEEGSIYKVTLQNDVPSLQND